MLCLIACVYVGGGGAYVYIQSFNILFLTLFEGLRTEDLSSAHDYWHESIIYISP